MSGIPILCSHCGRPIGGWSLWIGEFVYHEECTRGPSWQPTPQLTEEDVRRIVREELGRSVGP